MDPVNEVKTIANIILRKLYELFLDNPLSYHRLDLLFVQLNNVSPHYIHRPLFDSDLSYAVDREWIEYGETANEVRITADGCNEVLNV